MLVEKCPKGAREWGPGTAISKKRTERQQARHGEAAGPASGRHEGLDERQRGDQGGRQDGLHGLPAAAMLYRRRPLLKAPAV